MYPWIVVMSSAYPLLEEIRLKRMVVSDEALELISKYFKNFKVLVLFFCEGFSTDGLAAITTNCKFFSSSFLSPQLSLPLSLANPICQPSL